MRSVTETLGMGKDQNCGKLTDDSCGVLNSPSGANGVTSEPAAQLIWNCLVKIHKLYKEYHDSLFEATILAL